MERGHPIYRRYAGLKDANQIRGWRLLSFKFILVRSPLGRQTVVGSRSADFPCEESVRNDFTIEMPTGMSQNRQYDDEANKEGKRAERQGARNDQAPHDHRSRVRSDSTQ
jgi:hypothetical protein